MNEAYARLDHCFNVPSVIDSAMVGTLTIFSAGNHVSINKILHVGIEYRKTAFVDMVANSSPTGVLTFRDNQILVRWVSMLHTVAAILLWLMMHRTAVHKAFEQTLSSIDEQQ
jgi:hypothetical protein